MKDYLVVFGENLYPMCDFIETQRMIIYATSYFNALRKAERRTKTTDLELLNINSEDSAGKRFYKPCSLTRKKKAFVLDCKFNGINRNNYKKVSV